MYDFRIEADDKATLYRELSASLDALTAEEPDAIANMANASALIYETLPDINWVGFYRNIGGELVLGPFQGRPACIRIPFGTGVCGVAAQTRQVQRVDARGDGLDLGPEQSGQGAGDCVEAGEVQRWLALPQVLDDQVPDVPHVERRQTERGLVQQQQPRLRHQCLSHRQHLLLAAR